MLQPCPPNSSALGLRGCKHFDDCSDADMLLTRCWLAAVLLHNELCVREHALLCFVCVLRRGTLARNIKVAFCRSFHVPSKTAAGGCRRASVRPSSQGCCCLEISSCVESLGPPVLLRNRVLECKIAKNRRLRRGRSGRGGHGWAIPYFPNVARK